MKKFPANKSVSIIAGIIFILLFFSCEDNKSHNPIVKIKTSLGTIYIELYPEKAPKTCAAFLSYVNDNLFENSSFYRILNKENQPSDASKSELIQGGIWESSSSKAQSLQGIAHEGTNVTGILHKRGTISLARQDTGTATSEFFILVDDDAEYDFGGDANPDKQGYAAFGQVIKGMDVVNKIYNQPVNGQRFQKSIPIYKIARD